MRLFLLLCVPCVSYEEEDTCVSSMCVGFSAVLSLPGSTPAQGAMVCNTCSPSDPNPLRPEPPKLAHIRATTCMHVLPVARVCMCCPCMHVKSQCVSPSAFPSSLSHQ